MTLLHEVRSRRLRIEGAVGRGGGDGALHLGQGEIPRGAGDGQRRAAVNDIENLSQARAAEVRHADGSQIGGLVFVYRVDRHDVRVLKKRERLRFRTFESRELEHDEPTREIGLLGEENPSEAAVAELFEQPEAELLSADGETVEKRLLAGRAARRFRAAQP